LSYKIVLILKYHVMSERLSLEQKKYIKKHSELGKKCPSIAAELGVSVWAVRKWKQRIKKGLH